MQHVQGEMKDSEMAAAIMYSEEHHYILLGNGHEIMSFTSGTRLVCVRPRIMKIQFLQVKLFASGFAARNCIQMCP